MNCVHVVVNRVFRRRLINHLALENCTKRHKKLSNLLQITQTSLNNKQQHHRHQNWNVNSSILTKTIQGVFCYVEKVGQFHFGDEHPSKVICCYIQTFHFHSQNPDEKSLQNVSFYNITEHHWLLPRDTENYWNRSLRHFWVIFKLYEWAIQFKTVKLNFMDFAHGLHCFRLVIS